MDKVNVLGYNIVSCKKEECVKSILESHIGLHIVSGNPEVLYNGLNNEILNEEFINENTLIIPDGIGTKIAGKLAGVKIKEKIAGIDVMADLLYEYSKTKSKIYILGATQKSVEKCIDNIRELYKDINICGYRNGYFSKEEEFSVAESIKMCNPDIVFVALGCPKQEEFIIRYKRFIGARIYMGVGGSVDVLAGNIKRAPKWIIAVGMEWAYRVFKEPYRIKRLIVVPKFLMKVIKGRFNQKNNK